MFVRSLGPPKTASANVWSGFRASSGGCKAGTQSGLLLRDLNQATTTQKTCCHYMYIPLYDGNLCKVNNYPNSKAPLFGIYHSSLDYGNLRKVSSLTVNFQAPPHIPWEALLDQPAGRAWWQSRDTTLLYHHDAAMSEICVTIPGYKGAPCHHHLKQKSVVAIQGCPARTTMAPSLQSEFAEG